MADSFLQSSFKVSVGLRDRVRDSTAGMCPHTRYFFCHLVACSIKRLLARDSLWVPVPAVTINQYIRGADWILLQNLGLIEVGRYSRFKRECREYKVTERVLDELLAIELAVPVGESDRVNLFQPDLSKAVAKKLARSRSRPKEPRRIKDAIQVFRTNGHRFNRAAVEALLREEKEELQIAQLEVKCAEIEGGPRYGRAGRGLIKAKGLYQTDVLCYQSTLGPDRKPRQDGEVWRYTPKYSVSLTGRIHEVGGGLQSCSKRMKHAAYSGIPGVVNYDLKSSQVNGLIQQFEEFDCDPSWLYRYRDSRNAKQEYARRAGLSVTYWKRCLLAVVMGAWLPESAADYGECKSSILKYLAEEAGGDIEQMDELLAKFTSVVLPLKLEIDSWHDRLARSANKNAVYGRGGRYVKNACGKTLNVGALFRACWDQEAKAKLAAFYLQGQEAAFVHHLTLLGNKYDFAPIANEHDGLVTIGKIPAEAVEEARRLSGLKVAELEPKPFLAEEPEPSQPGEDLISDVLDAIETRLLAEEQLI